MFSSIVGTDRFGVRRDRVPGEVAGQAGMLAKSDRCCLYEKQILFGRTVLAVTAG
jgi:hypothetical protein